MCCISDRKCGIAIIRSVIDLYGLLKRIGCLSEVEKHPIPIHYYTPAM